jgi:hypothetical protein
MAVPHYVIDAPNGGGKVAILPQETLLYMDEDEVVVQNYEGNRFQYPQVGTTNVACGPTAVSAKEKSLTFSMVPFHTD